MSTGTALRFEEAYKLAEHVATELRPTVVRLKAVGSLRRRRPEVRDIEFLAEPRMIETDLFGTKAPDVGPVRAVLEQLGTWVKGGERMMQITDLLGREGLHLEVYLCHPPAQWGARLAVLTGPWELGRLAVTQMRDRGFRAIDGHVRRWPSDEVVPTPTEAEFFECAGIELVSPSERDTLVDRIQTSSSNGAGFSRTTKRV